MVENGLDEKDERVAERGDRRAARRVGVVFVHGVGEQRKSDTLLDFGEPLLGWLTRWCRARQEPAPTLERVELSFAPVDVGRTDQPSCATIRLGADTWVLTEAWWASSNRRPGFVLMLGWSFRYLWSALAQLVWAARQRLDRLVTPQEDCTAPAFWARLTDLVNTLGLLVLYFLGGLAGYAVLIPLLVLAQLPIEAVREFVLLRLVRPFLEINAGEFRTYLEEEIQAGNMQRRVAAAIESVLEAGCDEVVLIAHSQGAVVSFGMLTNPAHWEAARRVQKLITLGAGLNKAWLARPDLARLRGPLPRHIHWLDIWGSYDPVPAGWLEPPKDDRDDWLEIFRPSDAVQRKQRLERRPDPNPYAAEPGPGPALYWPVSAQVTNEMNVVSDHGAYWQNDEQVLVRLAAEIDATFYQDSRFWAGNGEPLKPDGRTCALRQVVRARRERVSLLALTRAAVILGWLLLTSSYWGELARHGVGLLTPLAGLPPEVGWAGPLADLARWLETLADELPLLASLSDLLLQVPFWLLAGLLLGLPFWALFSLYRAWLWEPWDRRARTAAIETIACDP